jgi:adenine-specific DNA-methyltransferase
MRFLLKKTMPTLEFKGKQFVYAHHLSVPFRQLEVDKSKSFPKGKGHLDDNLIIHGDNLHALKALLPTYAGKVKCIYIDPPYNTGNEGWCYNDNVRGPLIQEWIKKSANPVDREDLERHDKWLSMMWPRLQLLRELLAEDGLIFVSIDENEKHHLCSILNEIFGEENFIGDFIWHSTGHSDNQYDIKFSHEYILTFAKNAGECAIGNVVDPNTREESNLWKGYAENSITKNGPKNPPSKIKLPVGFPCKVKSVKLDKTTLSQSYFSHIKQTGYISRDNTKSHEVSYPIRLSSLEVNNYCLSKTCEVYSGWANANKLIKFIKNKCEPFEEANGDKLSFYLSEKGVIYYKRERTEARNILSVLLNFPTTEKMRSDLESIGIKFDYPKPVSLVQYLLQVANVKDGNIVLDSFCGSGTTAHAVMLLNKEKKIKAKFILVECEDYAYEKTAKRISLNIKGSPQAKEKYLKHPLKSSFSFLTLGNEINIESLLKGNNLPDYQALAKYVFYTATGRILEKVAKPKTDYYIGETDVYRVHLIYQPDKDFLRSNASALNSDMVGRISGSNKTGKKCLVFATAKFMGQRELTESKIEFCQLPYAIHRVLGG